MRRRDLITLLGTAAAAWPLAARAQQAALPSIGFLSSGSQVSDGPRLAPFRQGLSETGYVEGRSVAIEYRGMQGHLDLLPALITEFVSRPVAVIVVAAVTPGALAAKAATSTIPIVFAIGVDPVQAGLVSNFNRPGGNVTGISNLQGALDAKRLEVLHELLPNVTSVAALVNPSNAPYTEYETREMKSAAGALGLRLSLLNASTAGEIESAFATLSQIRAGALLVSSESFFFSRAEQIAALSARYMVPGIYPNREFTTAGGLMSYASLLSESYRELGIYTGRILKGEKPGDLPIQQSTKVEFVINLKTAKTLGITFPLTLLGRADEVIE